MEKQKIYFMTGDLLCMGINIQFADPRDLFFLVLVIQHFLGFMENMAGVNQSTINCCFAYFLLRIHNFIKNTLRLRWSEN